MNYWNVIIVDDEKDVHDVTRIALSRVVFRERKINLISVYSAEEAITLLGEMEDIALVILDIVMEEEDSGFKLIQYIRDKLKDAEMQIIIRTGHPGHTPSNDIILKYEVNDYQEKSELTSQKLKTSVITALRAYESLNKIAVLNKELEKSQYELFFSLGEIAESRSKETSNHVKRVGEIAKLIALKDGASVKEAEQLNLAATMHDLGKLAIPEVIISKPGKLSAGEYEIMKSHAQIGYDMMMSSNKTILSMAALIAKEHHENYDGTGYPGGLKGEEINTNSRIVAIADVFDALGNKRIYKEPWAHEEIVAYMKKESGKKFDPVFIDILMANIDELSSIRHKYPD